MQAGWPSASALPRGGLQGGGNIQGFNLRLTRNNGTVNHYEGKRVNEASMNTMKSNKSNTRKTNKSKTPKTTPKTVTSAPAPNGMKKIVHKGKLYFLSPNKDVFERSNTGEKGKRVGKLVRGPKGTTIKANKTMSIPETEATPPPIEEEMNENNGRNLNANNYEEMMNEDVEIEETPNMMNTNNQEGGRKRRKSRKHLRRK